MAVTWKGHTVLIGKRTNMNTKRRFARNLALGLVGAGLAGSPGLARAQSSDALIDKLVEKGILTVKEANDLREEADKNFTQAYSVKSGLPEWVSALKFNGDFRGRLDGIYSENANYEDRTRARYRLRFGVTASLFENFEVGLRLGSGELDSYPRSGIDPISQNQSFANNASKKGIFLDLAYAKWMALNSPLGTASFTFGKMENPFVFSDLVFDPDYTPEGFAVQSAFNLSDRHVLKPLAGVFVLDELGAEVDDPLLIGGQLRMDSTWTKEISTTAGLGVMSILNEEMLSNAAVPNVNAGNTRAEDGTLIYDYHPIIADFAITYTLPSFPMAKGPFPIKLGGDYMYNEGAPSEADNYAWSAGLTFGKASKRGTWELSYTYKWLGADAWWEELVDSDFGTFWPSAPLNSERNADFNAGTNLKGHVVRLAYAPYDFLTLSVKWFYVDLISTPESDAGVNSESNTHRILVDATLKF